MKHEHPNVTYCWDEKALSLITFLPSIPSPPTDIVGSKFRMPRSHMGQSISQQGFFSTSRDSLATACNRASHQSTASEMDLSVKAANKMRKAGCGGGGGAGGGGLKQNICNIAAGGVSGMGALSMTNSTAPDQPLLSSQSWNRSEGTRESNPNVLSSSTHLNMSGSNCNGADR